MSAAPTIVLVHGLAILRRGDQMFTGVAEALEARGHRVARTHAQGDGTLDELAHRVWQQLERIPAPYVLVCHSFGGLQARTFLLDDRKAEQIRGIATFGSPHAGSALASPMTPFNRAYRSLTRGARLAWNRQHGDEEQRAAQKHGIRCVSGIAKVTGLARTPQMKASQLILNRLEGPNDGLVSATSQAWGTPVFEVDLDHIECATVPGATRSAQAIDAWCRLAEAALG